MTVETSPAEVLALTGYTDATIRDDVIYGDPYSYCDGSTASVLRSGVDGPHAKLADQLCNLNGRQLG